MSRPAPGQGYGFRLSGALMMHTKSSMSLVSKSWIFGFTSAYAPFLGAGNAFLGGLSAGLLLAKGDVFRGMWVFFVYICALLNIVLPAAVYATVSASFIIEQEGLPTLMRKDDGLELWNDDLPRCRLEQLESRISD